MSLEVAQNVEPEIKTEIADVTAAKPIVVKAVVLRSDGTLAEIDYEIAPKKNVAKDIVGAPPTIIGEWDEIQVILIRGKHGSVGVPFNQHKLRYPFNGRQFRGDILLYRVNKDGKAENFTLQEYEAFVSRPDENAGKETQEPCMDAILEQTLESSYVEEHGDEEADGMSEEDLRREIAEAFEIIRAKGRHDAQYLAELVSETFYEINGREAELEDIANVFKRVKEQLAEEANDEVLDESEEEEVDQITAAIKDLLATNQTSTKSVENREELLNHARSVISESIAAEAREKFAKIAGRELTSEEFEDLLINLSKTKGEATLENEEDDSDYCPLDEAEQEQARADELEDLAIDKESEEEDKENEETTQEPIVNKKPIKFFSPVRTKKTAERLNSGMDSVDRKLMDRVVQHFRNIHKRDPTEQENANLWKFLTTGGLPVCELENEKDNEDSKSPEVKKVNFDSEDEESEAEEIVHVVD